MRMKVFHVGDRVRLSEELLRYSANKHWLGKRGTVVGSDGGYPLVQWDHLDKPHHEPYDHIELAPF